jgi:hypothetical protein
MTIPESVSIFLKRYQPYAYCNDCIREHVGLKRRQDAQRVTFVLGQTREFTREKRNCVLCGKYKKTTRANSN